MVKIKRGRDAGSGRFVTIEEAERRKKEAIIDTMAVESPEEIQAEANEATTGEVSPPLSQGFSGCRCVSYIIPEFGRAILESLRQPLEAGRVTVARANHHVTYPARFQLVAAMNPCRCGHLDNPALACSRAPRCARDYQGRISGPLLDRIDLQVEVPALRPGEIAAPAPGETRAAVAARVARAREIQAERFARKSPDGAGVKVAHAMSAIRTNAEADGALLDAIATPDAAGRELLLRATERMHLTARGWHRVLRVARTIADLDGQAQVARPHIAEALSFRRIAPERR